MRRLIKDTIFQLFFFFFFWSLLAETAGDLRLDVWQNVCAALEVQQPVKHIQFLTSNQTSDSLKRVSIHPLLETLKKKKKKSCQGNVSLKPLAPPTFMLSGVIKRSWTHCKATQIRWQRVIYHYFSALHGLFFYFSPEFLWDRLHV